MVQPLSIVTTLPTQLLFKPTPLGEALVAAYCAMQLENLWKPDLRGVIERNITAIAQRQRRKDDVLAEGIAAFRWADWDCSQDIHSHVARPTTTGQTCKMQWPNRAS